MWRGGAGRRCMECRSRRRRLGPRWRERGCLRAGAARRNWLLEIRKSKMEIGKRSQALLGGAWDFCFCGRREEFTRRTPREEHGEHRERNEGRKNKANAETRR